MFYVIILPCFCTFCCSAILTSCYIFYYLYILYVHAEESCFWAAVTKGLHKSLQSPDWPQEALCPFQHNLLAVTLSQSWRWSWAIACSNMGSNAFKVTKNDIHGVNAVVTYYSGGGGHPTSYTPSPSTMPPHHHPWTPKPYYPNSQ